MLAHRADVGVYPEGHTIAYHKEYCIIFGQPSQAEHTFQLAVIFVPIFTYFLRGDAL